MTFKSEEKLQERLAGMLHTFWRGRVRYPSAEDARLADMAYNELPEEEKKWFRLEAMPFATVFRQESPSPGQFEQCLKCEIVLKCWLYTLEGAHVFCNQGKDTVFMWIREAPYSACGQYIGRDKEHQHGLHIIDPKEQVIYKACTIDCARKVLDELEKGNKGRPLVEALKPKE